MAFLVPDKIRVEHGLTIKEKIIPWGAKWPRASGKYKKGDRYKADRKLSGGTGEVKKITVHNTNDIQEAKGTNDAEQYARATWPNANMGDARVHYYIDETDCWQLLREDEVGWHAGDGNYGPGNDTSLAIEIIMDGSGSAADTAAEDRGALLAAILLDRHGLGIGGLATHKDWSGKNCPQYILPHWAEFRAKVEKYLKQIQGAKPGNSSSSSSGSGSKAGVTTIELRTIREGDRGEDVRCLQFFLRGWSEKTRQIIDAKGGADAIFGNATGDALEIYQSLNVGEDGKPLEPDRICGPKCWGAIHGKTK